MTEKCEKCGRPLPSEKPADPNAPRRKIFSVSVPAEEMGVLDDMCEQLVAKYQERWPDELRTVGAKQWKYRAVHFAIWAALEADLVPSETGG